MCCAYAIVNTKAIIGVGISLVGGQSRRRSYATLVITYAVVDPKAFIGVGVLCLVMLSAHDRFMELLTLRS